MNNMTFSLRKLKMFLPVAIVWMLWAFNAMNRDRDVYEKIYAGLFPHHEPLYIWINGFFNRIGVSYQTFYMVIATLCVFLLLNFAKRWTMNWHWFFLLLIIYPLPILITVVRNAITISIVLYALKYLDNEKKYGVVFFIGFVLLGTGIHYSTIIFLILILVKSKSQNKLLVCSLSIGALGLFFACTDVIHNLLSLFTQSEKILQWFIGKANWGIVLSVAIHIYTYIVFRFCYMKLKNAEVTSGTRSFLHLAYNINSVSFAYWGLYAYNIQFLGRIYLLTVLVNYIVMVELFTNKNVGWKLNEKVLYFIMIAGQVFLWTFVLYGLDYLELAGYLLQNCLWM